MTNPQETVNNLLDAARSAVELALTLGRQYNVRVDLNKVGLGDADDMWYVSLDEYRQELMDNLTYDGHTPTQEELQEVEDRLKSVEEEGGYEDGYKVVGWMSSSTNC